MLLSRVTFVAAIVSLSSFSPALAQVNIIQAPANYQFIDMGYDAENDEIAIVGHIIDGNTETATIFELNATNNGFTTQTLADLPGATDQQRAQVTGISSDTSRISGASGSSNY